jgi:molecular chaperone GrpE
MRTALASTEPERKVMPVASEHELAADLDAPGLPARADDPGLPAPPVPGDSPGPAAGAPGLSADEAAAGLDAAGPAEPTLAELSAAVRELAGAAERYHDRAAQREGVIDYLRSELETLRRGERRGMLRPLLTEMCRLRNDLLRQAATLPPVYDAEQAAKLLASFAETVDLTLENNGVASYRPDEGDPFDPRRHRRLRGAESADPAQAGRIAQVLRDGYLDTESSSPVVPAEVTVFMAVRESK